MLKLVFCKYVFGNLPGAYEDISLLQHYTPLTMCSAQMPSALPHVVEGCAGSLTELSKLVLYQGGKSYIPSFNSLERQRRHSHLHL